MKIGVFDSGVGGLIILQAISKKLPAYDFVFLADTKHVPYGDKTQKQIFDLSKKAMAFLFAQDCELVIMACNTASAKALRKLQQTWLPKHFPNRRILGMVVPTVEVISKRQFARVGLVATKATVRSSVYKKELKKINPDVRLFQITAPLLVPLIESGNFKLAHEELERKLTKLIQKKVKAVILGCTHYALIKRQAQKIAGKKIHIVSQDDVVPNKLVKYLGRHPELTKRLSQKSTKIFFSTNPNPGVALALGRLFKSAKIKKAMY